jgi:hypothetical protein
MNTDKTNNEHNTFPNTVKQSNYVGSAKHVCIVLIDVLNLIDTLSTYVDINKQNSLKSLKKISDLDFAIACNFLMFINKIAGSYVDCIQDFEMFDIEFKQLHPIKDLNQIINVICEQKNYNTMSDIENFLVSIQQPTSDSYIKSINKFRNN